MKNRNYESALIAIENLVRAEPEELEFFLSEKKERGPKRKTWKTYE